MEASPPCVWQASAMLKNVVISVMTPVLLFCSCKDGDQADLGAEGGTKMENESDVRWLKQRENKNRQT